MFEIGDSLREARLRRSIDFPQVEQATKIRSKYLRALEDEQFEQLPSPTYVKGFLQAYADYLGLDGRLYVDEYNSRFVVGDEWEGRRRRSSPRRGRRAQTGVVVVALAAIALLTIVISSAWSLAGGSPPAHHPPKRTAASRPRTPVAYLRIVPLHGASYVEIHRGGPAGVPLFEGTIAAGNPALALSQHTLGKDFWVDVSSPQDVAISIDGHPLVHHGSKPETLSVTPSGVRAA